MTILLTGAAGRLGSACCERLTRDGHSVRATDRVCRPDMPAARQCLADLTDPIRVHELTEGVDAIVHLGNHPNQYPALGARIFGENSRMNGNVFSAAVERGIPRVVFASSIQAFTTGRRIGGPSTLPYVPLDGDIPANPGNAYALSKAAGEQLLDYYCDGNGIDSAVSLRLPHLYKSRDICWLAEQAQNPDAKYPQWGDTGDELGTFMTYDESARLISHCVRASFTGHHVLFPSIAENKYLVPAEELYRRSCPGVPQRRPFDGPRGLVDIEPLQRLVGYTPPSWEELLAQAEAEKA